MKIQFYQRKIKYRELRLITRQMASMLESGCEIGFILELLIEGSSKRVSEVLSIVRRNVLKGRNLNESFYISNAFNNFFINMVKAGEMSGRMDYVFREISRYYHREEKIRKKIIGASIYPSLLLLTSLIVFNIILIFVIPKFEGVFMDGGLVVSESTKRMFAISKFIREKYPYILIGLAFLVYACIRVLKTNMVLKEKWDRLIFKLPKIGRLRTIIISEKFARCCSILLGSGIGMKEAIEISANVLNNEYLKERLCLTNDCIERGLDVSSAMEVSGIFPKSFLLLIKTGEEGGDFVNNLDYIAGYFQEELDEELENILKLLEPIFLIFIGLLIGFVLINILGPIYDLIGSM